MPGARTFKNELLQLSNVEDVAFCQGYPVNGGNNYTGIINDKTISFQVFSGDSAYFKMMGFEIVQDNHIADWGIWLNETAMRELELPYDAKNLDFWGGKSIAGIIKDFHYRDFSNKVGPAMLYYNNFTNDNNYVWSFLVKVNGDPVKALNDVRNIYEKASDGEVFTGQYIDDILQQSCEKEKKTSTILLCFTIMAIVISSLGLYAMALYFIRQRAGEIAVRKIFGSTNNQIVIKLLKSFLFLVVLAMFIALPVIWYFMSEWLSKYPIHISLNTWIFVAGSSTALLIAFLIVIFESIKAANANPIGSIKK
jgi:putative ABC transport system permease protein